MGRRGCRGLALPVGLGQGRRLWDSWEDVPLRSLMKRQARHTSARPASGVPGEALGGAQAVPTQTSTPGSWGGGPAAPGTLVLIPRTALVFGGEGPSERTELGEGPPGVDAGVGGETPGVDMGGDAGCGHRGWPPGVDGSTRCSCPTRRRAQLLRGPGLRCGRCWGWRFPALLLGMPSAGSELPVTGGVRAAPASPQGLGENARQTQRLRRPRRSHASVGA